jgi:hypothetical protein
MLILGSEQHLTENGVGVQTPAGAVSVAAR